MVWKRNLFSTIWWFLMCMLVFWGVCTITWTILELKRCGFVLGWPNLKAVMLWSLPPKWSFYSYIAPSLISFSTRPWFWVQKSTKQVRLQVGESPEMVGELLCDLIEVDPWDERYICLHEWLIFNGFHVGEYTRQSGILCDVRLVHSKEEEFLKPFRNGDE